MSKDIDFLKTVKILSDLTEDQFQKFFNICKKVRFKQGEIIMAEGETGDTMYIFEHGEVEIVQNLTMKVGKGKFEEVEKSLNKINAAGIFLGDMALLSNSPRSATIRADSECTCYEIAREDFSVLCGQDSNLGYKIIKRISEELCKRLDTANQNVLKLTTVLSFALSKK